MSNNALMGFLYSSTILLGEGLYFCPVSSGMTKCPMSLTGFLSKYTPGLLCYLSQHEIEMDPAYFFNTHSGLFVHESAYYKKIVNVIYHRSLDLFLNSFKIHTHLTYTYKTHTCIHILYIGQYITYDVLISEFYFVNYFRNYIPDSYINSKKFWFVSTQIWVKYGQNQMLG